MRKFFKYFSILLMLFWMIVVFMLSAEPSKKSENTSDNFTKIIFNNITDKRVQELSFIVRKSAHFTLYTLGGMCICVSVMLNYNKSSKKYLISFIIGSIYAITDEIHQFFVPGRSCELRDVIIDSSGILIGIIIIKCFEKVIYKFRRSD